MPKELVIGKIEKLYEDNRVAWKAFDQAEEDCDRLRAEIKRLKLRISQLERKKK